MTPSNIAYLEQFQALFSGREAFYGQYGDGAEKKIQTLTGETPVKAWERHINGEGPYLGQVPIRLDNTCYFGAIDIDDDVIDHQALAKRIADFRLPLIVCRSKSGGAHCYLFFEKPVAAPIVVRTLKNWAEMLGHTSNNDGRAIEIFPKQTALRPKDSGNWINLPYYGGDASNRKAVNSDGELLDFGQFIAVAEMKRVKDARALADIQPATGKGAFSDGPPCLQKLHVIGYAEGTRNSGLYNVAVFFKLAFPDDWQDRVATYNGENFTPPLTEREVKTVCQSVERKDYSYNCDELPIQPHCQRGLCNKRRFGIASLKSTHNIKMFPKMTNLRKILTDPPRWLVSVEGTDVELTTDDITQLTRLRKVLFEQLNIVIPVIKPTDYDDILRNLLKEHELIEAPEDAGIRGQFLMLIDQFMARAKSAESREDIAQGLPFGEDGRVYFRSSDLLSFLERKRFYKYAASEIYTALRSIGAEHSAIRTKKAVIKVWSIPESKQAQTEDFDPLDPAKLGVEY